MQAFASRPLLFLPALQHSSMVSNSCWVQETLPPAAAFDLKPREGAAPAHADSNDKDDDLTGVGDAEAAATGGADQHGVKDDMDEDCDEACASGAENVAGAEANEAVESGDHLTADTNEDAMDREDVSAKFGSEQLGSDRFEVDGGGGGEEDVADCGHQETSRKREVDGDGGGHEEREGDKDESREAAEKREGDSNDAPSAEVCGSRVKDEEMEAGGGVAKEDLQEEEGGLDERAPSDVKMKDVKDEADGTEAGDVEENAGLGTAASDSRDHDAIAAMLSMANGDVSMDDGEAREIADRKPKDGSPTDAATGGSEPSSTHATGQAGAATAAASAREPSPAGPKDPMSSAKALLAAKLKTRPQSTHVQLGAVTVKRLGTVVSDRPAYHSRRFLYPVGFLSERTYSSYRQAGGKTVYTCEILDGGERPEFKISVADDVDNPIVAGDPTSAWRVVEQRVQALPANGEARTQQRLCGAVYFGLAHPSIIKRLQELGGAKKCEKYLFDRKHAQLLETASEAEPQQAIGAPRSPTHLNEIVGRNNIGSGAGAARANDTSVLKHLGTTDTDVAGEWLPIMEKELAMIKDRTNATIQPLSKSQLLPDGWSPQEVETFFNGLNEHQMQAAPLAAAITTKSAQQVHDYTQYVCEVMDRRVKASREEQLQKHASALQTAMQAASHASSAKDAGAVALQAAMVAAANVPKEATQLKEMFKQPTGHSTLAQVLTHLWHTERLWRHALQQGLQLFQETHQLSDRMMERLHNLRNKLVKASAQKSSSGGLGGVSDAMLKKRLEEESKKIRAEFSEKTKKMLEQVTRNLPSLSWRQKEFCARLVAPSCAPAQSPSSSMQAMRRVLTQGWWCESRNGRSRSWGQT